MNWVEITYLKWDEMSCNEIKWVYMQLSSCFMILSSFFHGFTKGAMKWWKMKEMMKNEGNVK